MERISLMREIQKDGKKPAGVVVGSLVTTVAVAVLACAQVSWSAPRWENHVDASSIREIVYRDGSLVMATNGGVLIFDPATGEFTQYNNTSGLPSNALTCLVFDNSGYLWVGTEDIGIGKVSLGAGGLRSLKTFNAEFDGLSSNEVRSIAIWQNEVVYGTANGAGRFSRELPSARFYKADGLPSNTVFDVFPDGDFVWIATDSGSVVLDRFGFLTPPTGGPPTAFSVARSDDAVWLGTADGVWRMDLSDSSWAQTGPSGETVYSLHWDGSAMWAGGKYRFYDYNGSSWTAHSLLSYYGNYGMSGAFGEIRTINSTPGGDIFVGALQVSASRGMNLIKYDGTITNLSPNTPGGNFIQRLSLDLDGSIWVSAMNFGVGKLTPAGRWVNYNTSIPEGDSLSNLFANTTMLADSDGHKWFSTMNWDPDNPRPLDELDDKLDDDYSNDVWTRHGPNSGGGDTYGSMRPQMALEDPAGNRWFLSDDQTSVPDWVPGYWNGINILSRDKSEWLQIRPGLIPQMSGGSVTDVAFGDGVAYLALKFYGVQSWNHNGNYDWASLKDKTDDSWGVELNAKFGVQMVAGASVTSLALRSDGVLWIGTDNGVIKYTPFNSYRHIEQNQGFGVGLLSPLVRDIVLDDEENLWVATSMGVNKIARDNDDDIEAYTTAAEYQTTLFKLQYPFSIISALANADCYALVKHPERDLLYVGTNGGLSIMDISPEKAREVDLSGVYVYPNPVDVTRQHDYLYLCARDVTEKLKIEIYNLEGNLVDSKTGLEPGCQIEIWDLTTRDNFIVSSGVYFVRISAGGKAVIKPISVVR